jgi:ankyrin repeat protein
MKYLKQFEILQGSSITKSLKQDILITQNGWNELMSSITFGDKKLFYKLIKDNSINLEETDYDGNTALILAAKNHKLDFIKELLKNGANMLHKNYIGEDFYDASVNTYINNVKNWIEKKYPGFIIAKKYNL